MGDHAVSREPRNGAGDRAPHLARQENPETSRLEDRSRGNGLERERPLFAAGRRDHRRVVREPGRRRLGGEGGRGRLGGRRRVVRGGRSHVVRARRLHRTRRARVPGRHESLGGRSGTQRCALHERSAADPAVELDEHPAAGVPVHRPRCREAGAERGRGRRGGRCLVGPRRSLLARRVRSRRRPERDGDPFPFGSGDPAGGRGGGTVRDRGGRARAVGRPVRRDADLGASPPARGGPRRVNAGRPVGEVLPRDHERPFLRRPAHTGRRAGCRGAAIARCRRYGRDRGNVRPGDGVGRLADGRGWSRASRTRARQPRVRHRPGLTPPSRGTGRPTSTRPGDDRGSELSDARALELPPRAATGGRGRSRDERRGTDGYALALGVPIASAG